MAKSPEVIEMKVVVEVSVGFTLSPDESLTAYELADNEKLWIKNTIEDALDGKVVKIAVTPVIK